MCVYVCCSFKLDLYYMPSQIPNRYLRAFYLNVLLENRPAVYAELKEFQNLGI